MAYATGESPTPGGSNDFSDGEPTTVDRSIAAVVEVRNIAVLDERLKALVGGAA